MLKPTSIVFVCCLMLLLLCNLKGQQQLLGTKWCSDSINDPSDDHWREWLFIQENGRYLRASWFSEGSSYILDHGLFGYRDSMLYSNSGTRYEVIYESRQRIVVQGPNFYAEFRKGSHTPDDFLVGDSIRAQIQGTWRIDSIDYLIDDISTPKDSIDAFSLERLNSVAQNAKIAEGVTLEFQDSRKAIWQNKDHTTNFKYTVDNRQLELRFQDMLIYLDILAVSDNSLLIKGYSGYGRTIFRLTKVE